MTPTPGGSPAGPVHTPDRNHTGSTGDPDSLTPVFPRCELCRGQHPPTRPDGRAEVLVCPYHLDEVNHTADLAAGLDPHAEASAEIATYGHLPQPPPEVQALYPADGLHTHMTLSDVTAAAIARLLVIVMCPPAEGCYKVRNAAGQWVCVKCGH